jgi:methionine-S-sulfoxide reductase
VDGIVRTRVGYSGGTKRNPTYHSLGDHTESLQVDYDAAKLSYDDILGLYFEKHHPAHPTYSQQYRSALWYANEEEHAAIDRHIRALEQQLGRQMFVDVEPVREFWLAEDYHQKYYVRSERTVVREFSAIYPAEEDFVNSTAVARANGYVGGYGDPQQDIGRLGLSQEAQDALLRLSGRRARFSCGI